MLVQNYLPVISAFILFFVVIILFRVNCQNAKESWVNYQNFPYGNIDSGKSNPLVMYNVPRYRKPYNWPQCFITEHPEKHCRHYQ